VLFKGSHLTRHAIEPLWEERILLIRSDTDENAAKEATRLSQAEVIEYDVLDGGEGEPAGKLKWTFEQVERVYKIEDDDLASGAEIFSRFLRDSEVKSLLTPFRDK